MIDQALFRRTAAALVLASGCALAAPGAAAGAGDVSSDGATVTYRARGDASNTVGVGYDAARGKYLIREDCNFCSDALVPGPGCVREEDRFGDGQFPYYAQVACDGPGVTKVEFHLGPGEIDWGQVDGAPPAAITFFGGDGRDYIVGGPGNDVLLGEGGGDTLQGGAGADFVDGGPAGEEEAEDLYGYAMDRFTFGQTGAEFAAASEADGGDVLGGADGTRNIDGQGGADTIAARGGSVIDGGTGDDAISGDGLPTDASIVGGDGHDRITGVVVRAEVSGGDGNDILHGGHVTSLDGGPGDDSLSGSGRADGGPGRDMLAGSARNDRLFGGLGNDVLFGRAGRDALDGSTGDDRAFGGPGRDTYQKLFHTGGCRGKDLFVGDGGRDFAHVSCGLVRFRLRDGQVDRVTCRRPAPVAVAKILNRDRADEISGCRR